MQDVIGVAGFVTFDLGQQPNQALHLTGAALLLLVASLSHLRPRQVSLVVGRTVGECLCARARVPPIVLLGILSQK